MKDTTKAQMMKLVTKMIDGKIEDKVISQRRSIALHNSSITTGDCITLVPAVPQGTADWQRIGDKIKPKYLRVDVECALNYDPTNQTPALGGGFAFSGNRFQSPLVARLICFTQADIKTATTGSAVDTGSLLRGDNGVNVGYTGTNGDNLRPINTGKFRVLKDKKFELVPIPGPTVDGVYKTNVRMSFKLKPPTFKYDSTTGDIPLNYCPFIAVGYNYPNGSPADVVSTALTMIVISTLVYEDA